MFGKVKWTAAVGAGGLAIVVVMALAAGIASAQGPGSWGRWGGMMGGWSAPQNNGNTPGWQGYGMMGRGMMGGWAAGAGNGYGCPGAGGWGFGNPATNTTRISLEKATQMADQFVAGFGNTDLKVAEVMEFDYNFYARVQEQSTKINAFELLVDPYTGYVRPEPGPDMMWNTKYGHMAGWWANNNQAQPGAMAVDAQQARDLAQKYLDTNLAGTTAGAPETFYGYYTVDVMKDGQVAGMLSVNGTTGEVWYHTWHGDFVQATGDEG